MEKEVSCIDSIAILDYVKAHNKGECSALFEDLDPEIDDLPDIEAYLRDPNNWVSSRVISKLHERARLLFDDERTSYNIARHAVENMNLGYARALLVRAFWSYRKALKHAQRINDKWNRSKRIELVNVGRKGATVRLHWDPDMYVTKDLCYMNQGIFAFLPLVWGGTPITLSEECCFFEGAPYCEYRLTWPARNRLHEIWSRFFISKSFLKHTIMEMETEKRVIEEKYKKAIRLNEELNRKIKQFEAIQETGKAILSVLDLGPLITAIMNILSSVCSVSRALIMLVNEEGGYLEYLHAVGFDGEVPEAVKQYRVPLDHVTNLLVRVTNSGRPEYVPEVKKSPLKRDNIIIAHGKPSSIYVVPLITRSKVIGVIATDAVNEKGIPKETRETLEIFAPQIAIAIENARLYKRLQHQMEEIKRSHALLSRADKFSFLGNLAARLAHEIKNPLTAIRAFIQMLPHKYEDEEFRKQFHDIALEEINRVNHLITELLDLVKKKESHFELSDLHSLIDRMVLLVSPRTKAKEIQIIRRFDTQVGPVWLDPEKIKQVILNLLSNAVEFTPQGGKVEIITENSMEQRGSRHIQIKVRDNGPGIPKETLDRVFEPYFTTKRRSGMHNGAGLGLFIALQNVRDHGGDIKVMSEVNRGATFTVTLPLDQPPHRSLPGEPHPDVKE